MTTPEYHEWWIRRINDNTHKLNQENNQSIEESLRVVPSELEIIRQDFERRNADLEKKIEQMEEEKMNLRLDIDVQKLETDKLRKKKNKAEEKLGSLKTNYKKLRLSMRAAGLGKTSEQWWEEIREEKDKADRWERKFQEIQMRNEVLERSLSDSQREKCELKDRIKYLKANESRNNEQLHYFQSQVRSRDHLMEEAVVKIRGVADHIQTLAVQTEKSSVLNVEEGDSEGLVYPPGFTLQQVEVYPYKSSVTIKPQQFQAGMATPMNFQAGSGSNPRDNLVNPAVPDFDETTEKEKMNDELPKQLEKKYKWLEEKFRAIECAEN
ncbi:uncharacterized protein LOC105795971 [Gossypium raimondii]|uniref:uncharacterized protein LOC105795971 n=1 Tax=Gossypium raimondii TaxID=29730 RepID=UPI00063AE443|nr:uncharacterized protein LOC105795971 [Gossypium raimondii]